MKLNKKMASAVLMSSMILAPMAGNVTTFAATDSNAGAEVEIEDSPSAHNGLANHNSEIATEYGDAARQESAKVQENINTNANQLGQAVQQQFDAIKAQKEAQGAVNNAEDTYAKADRQVANDADLNKVIGEYQAKKDATNELVNARKDAEKPMDNNAKSQKALDALTKLAEKRVAGYTEKIKEANATLVDPDASKEDKDAAKEVIKEATKASAALTKNARTAKKDIQANYDKLFATQQEAAENARLAQDELKTATDIYNELGKKITNDRNALIKDLNISGYKLAPNATAEEIKEAARQNLATAHQALDKAQNDLLQSQAGNKTIIGQLLDNVNHKNGLDAAAKLADTVAKLGQIRADAIDKSIIGGSEDHSAQTPVLPEEETTPETPEIDNGGKEEVVTPEENGKGETTTPEENTKPEGEVTPGDKEDSKTDSKEDVKENSTGNEVINLGSTAKGGHTTVSENKLPQLGAEGSIGTILAGISTMIGSFGAAIKARKH